MDVKQPGVVFGTSNQNFLCFRKFRYWDSKKGAIYLKCPDTTSSDTELGQNKGFKWANKPFKTKKISDTMDSERDKLLSQAHDQVYEVADSIRFIAETLAERELDENYSDVYQRADNLSHAADQFQTVGQIRREQRKRCCPHKKLIVAGVVVIIIIIIIIIVSAT